MRARRIWQVALLLASHAILFAVARQHHAAGRASASTLPTTEAAGSSPKTKSSPRGGGKISSHRDLLAELAGSKLSREDYEKARLELFRDWIHRDLRGAMDMLYGAETRGRYGDLTDELEDDLKEEILHQPLAVWEWMLDGRYGSGRPELYDLWLETLVLGGESKLALQLMAEGPKMKITDSLQNICSQGNAAQLETARELLSQLDPKTRDRNYDISSDYAARKLELALGDAVGCLQDESDPKIREALVEAWVTRELRLLPAGTAVAKLKELPEDVRAAAVEEMLGSDRRGGFEGTLELLTAIDREGLWQSPMRHDTEGQDGGTLEERAGQKVWDLLDDSNDRDPNRIAGELTKISTPAVRESALSAAAEGIYRGGRGDELLEMVDGMPVSRDRDALLAGLLNYLDDDAESYGAILDRVSDPQLREKYTPEAPEPE